MSDLEEYSQKYLKMNNMGKAPYKPFDAFTRVKRIKTFGPTCDFCNGTKPFGNCANCAQPLRVTYQGQFDDGEHVCSIECVNDLCDLLKD